MYRTPGIQKGPVDSHTRRIGGEEWGSWEGAVWGWVCWSRGEAGDSRRGHPASVTAQAVVLRKIRTSSLY